MSSKATSISVAILSWAVLALCPQIACALGDYRDILDKALTGQEELPTFDRDTLSVYARDQYSYETNLYRLPANVNIASVVGPRATGEDHINSASLGLDGQWNVGRQILGLDLRADDNRFTRNGNLDNTSGNDKFLWDWRVGDQFSGEAGAYYYSALASFVNSDTYTKNLISSDGYYGTARYQVGPRWAVYAGLLESQVDLTAEASKSNNNRSKIVQLGTELTIGPSSSVGWEYRFTDLAFPHTDLINGSGALTDYKEDLGRFLLKYAISDKTSLDANAGYLKRDYVNSNIPSFSGDVWHIALQWLPTDRTQLLIEGWRHLQVYLTAQTEYFVSKGISLSPVWTHSEKLNIAAVLSHDNQNYADSGLGIVGIQNRRDTVTAGQVAVTYAPFKAVTLTFSYRHELRNSNEAQFKYDDNLVLAGVMVRH